MNIFTSELLGSFFLILFGGGVVANVILKDTKGHGSGFVLINFGWAMAVFIGVSIASASHAHLNPAVTVAMAVLGKVNSSDLPAYFSGQFLGSFLGAIVMWFMHRLHFDATPDAGFKLAVFSTGPAIRNTFNNLISEIIATFAFMSAILFLPQTTTDLGHLNPLPVSLIVLGVGMCLGGTTGYAINPARDLAPRLAHAILPIKDKGGSDWAYAWIPVVGPIAGALLAVALFNFVVN
jgi:glycerol uptake facilitator protein